MKQVTAFEATDGSLHQSEAACQAHEVGLKWKETIRAFTNSGLNPYTAGAQAGMCMKILIAWETFKEQQRLTETTGAQQ